MSVPSPSPLDTSSKGYKVLTPASNSEPGSRPYVGGKMRNLSKVLASLTAVAVMVLMVPATGSAQTASVHRDITLHDQFGDAAVTALTYMPATATPAVAESSNGCNGYVCIYVTGKKLIVTQWRTVTDDFSVDCTRPNYLINFPGGGSDDYTGAEICLGPGVYTDTWNNPGLDGGYFPNQTQLCNTWDYIYGEPCETVHS